MRQIGNVPCITYLKNAYSFYFSLFLVLSSFIPLFFYIYLMCLFLFVFPSSYSCVSFIASQRTHRFVARIFRKRTMIYEDPWRVMSKSSRIAVSTKGTNMIVYHRVCACMCARVCDCVRVRVPTLVVQIEFFQILRSRSSWRRLLLLVS